METKFIITCGTYSPQKFEVDLDEFGVRHKVASTDEQKKEAFNLLVKTMDDITFASSGHRNDDAVNTVIALHVLGYVAHDWLESFCDEQPLERWWVTDLQKFMDHVDRVDRYVRDWGPDGDEGNALLYALWN